MTTSLTFKKIQETDLDIICTWLDKPHVKKWWHDDLTHDEVKMKYRERIDSTTIVPYIICSDNKPIGIIQYYIANKVRAEWWPDAKDGTIGIDLFIGDEAYINKGYGTKLIRTFTKQLFNDATIIKIITDVDPSNQRAIRCYEKAGFKFIKEITTPDGIANLMELYRQHIF